MSTLGLERLPGRCPTCAFHVATQGCRCGSELDTFVGVLRSVAIDGVVHQRDARPVLRDIFPPRRIGTCYSGAIREGLIVEIDRERSNDVAGRNTNKLEPVYRLRDVA